MWYLILEEVTLMNCVNIFYFFFLYFQVKSSKYAPQKLLQFYLSILKFYKFLRIT